MDGTRWKEVERVVDAALESDPSSWPGILDERCGADVELRREVEALLGRYHSARRYLESPPLATAAALVHESRGAAYTREGTRIGAYRIVREIGRGGTAIVFLAQRDDGQFTQQVALKLLRPGHDSDLDQGRFRAERQILASLSHPNIARLLDGGVTNDGLPYLVIEVVEGEPIDRYCDARALPVRQRLEMFLTVLEATQYAHRNLIVHRDLKPSNILVTTDGVVKLLDFGLAKLLDPATAETGLTTQRWMTPEYAAPEQVRSAPATTLTDVYQLGVVLYQLLTGRLPFGTRHQNFHELERAILEQEPPAPSSNRRELRGDLDAIILKALEKAPDERYDSAQALADDLRRHLAGHPVLARPQTVTYRARRFARRQKWAVAAATAAMAVIGAYLVTITVQRRRVERALAQATVEAQKAERVTDLMLGLFEASEGGRAFSDTVTARDILDRGIARAHQLTGQPVIQAQMLDVIGQLYVQLGAYDRARSIFQEALATRRRELGGEHPDVATTIFNLADAASRRSDSATAVSLHREALAIRRRVLGPTHTQTLESMYWLADAVHQAGDFASAAPLFEEWMAAVASQPPEISLERGNQLIRLGQVFMYRREYAKAEQLLRQALEVRKAYFGPRHFEVGNSYHQLALAIRGDQRREEAEQMLRESIAILRVAHPDGAPTLARAMRSLGLTLVQMNRLDEALPLFEEAERMLRRFHGENSPHVANVRSDLGNLHRRREAYDRAEPYLREALRALRGQFADDNLMVLNAQIDLGDALRGRGAFAEAEPLLVGGYEGLRGRRVQALGEDRRPIALASLVKLYQAQRRESEAAKYRALLDSATQAR
jgi:serine/threonine-protein kinase